MKPLLAYGLCVSCEKQPATSRPEHSGPLCPVCRVEYDEWEAEWRDRERHGAGAFTDSIEEL